LKFKLFYIVAFTANLLIANPETDIRIIKADFNDVKGKTSKMPKKCVGSGYAPLALRADWQQHLATVKKECDFDYVRFHGIFHDNMGIFNTTIPTKKIPSKYLSPGNGSKENGLKAEYFNNTNLLDKPVLVRIDKIPGSDWNNKPPGKGLNNINFSVRWTGKLTAPVSGLYDIGAVADDGVRFYIDGELVAEDWTIHAPTLIDGRYYFEKDKSYDIKIEYFQGKSGFDFSLEWAVPWKKPLELYNWQYVDKVYDYILSVGMKPFVELSFMPEELASNREDASGRTTVFWYEGNVTPPKSYKKWGDFVQAFVQHLTDRYGNEEVEKWYFEVWNEPNCHLFWTSDLNEYLKLYEYTARAVKKVDTKYRVGGPATAASVWVKETLDFCDTNNVPIDFIATHVYGVEKGVLDETGKADLIMSTNRNRIIDQVRKVRETIDSTKYKGMELHYTEWSLSYSSRDAVHDSYHSAPYILQKVKGTEGLADSMSYWTFSDVFEEGGPGGSPFHGGFAMLNLQGLKKPSFYSYKFFNQLGDTELKCEDEDSWVCTDGTNIQVLFWDFTVVKQDAHNKTYFKRILPSKNAGKILVELSNVPEGKYQLNVYKTGYRVNDVYSDFCDMGSPMSPTPKQIAELAKKNDGSPIETETVVIDKNGKFKQEFDIRENDVFLLTLDYGVQ